MTGTTIGYGDFVPTSAAARVFSVFIAFIGVALMTLFTAHVVAFFIGRDEAPAAETNRALATLRNDLAQLSSGESMRLLREVQQELRAVTQELTEIKCTLKTHLALLGSLSITALPVMTRRSRAVATKTPQYFRAAPLVVSHRHVQAAFAMSEPGMSISRRMATSPTMEREG